MAKKLRKMLGSVDDERVTELMKLIDTQSKATVSRWCAAFVRDNVLQVYEKHCPGDTRPRQILETAIDCADGKLKFAEVKKLKTETWERTAELNANPAAIAAARAIVDTASMVWQTPTHSLGALWYSGAAVAYDRAGLEASDGVYDEIADEVLINYLDSLKKAAVEDEPKPLKCKWNC